MNCNRHISILLLGAALAAPGCRYNVPEDYDPEVELQLTPVMYESVKATGAGEYPEDQPFGLYAWSYDVGETWNEGQPFLNDAKVAYDGNKWSLPSRTFWPSKDQRLAVLSYSPFGSAYYVDLEAGVVWRGIDTRTDQTDYLYLEPKTGLDKLSGGGIINLPFRHAMAVVDFKIKHNVDEVESLNVTEVSFTDLGYKGDFRSLPFPVWTCTDDREDTIFFEGSQVAYYEPTPIGMSLNVIPQTLSSTIRVKFQTVSSGIYQDYTLESRYLDYTLDPGRHYTYTISIRPDSLDLVLDIVSDITSG